MPSTMVSTWMTAEKMGRIPFGDISLRWQAGDNSLMAALVLHQQFGDIERKQDWVFGCKCRSRVSGQEMVSHSSRHCLFGYRTAGTQWNLMLLRMSYQKPLETFPIMSIFVCTIVEQEEIYVNGLRLTSGA